MKGETKEERFRRVVQKRVQNVLDSLRRLSQCSNRRMYDWSDEQMKKIWSAIDKELKSCKEGFEKAVQARMLAEEQLDAEEKKFEVGTSTNFQVLEFQKDLTESIMNEVMARIEFNKSKYDLEKTVGTFLDAWDIQIK